MSTWSFWEWLAYGPIALSALISASDWGVKAAPNIKTPSWFASVYWSLTPLLLLAVSGLLFLGISVGFLSSALKMENVFNTTYTHQTVSLDNHAFFNCVFDDVTFIYKGGGYFFENAVFKTRVEVNSAPGPVANTARLYRFLASQFPTPGRFSWSGGGMPPPPGEK
jgi:hypothetical protein